MWENQFSVASTQINPWHCLKLRSKWGERMRTYYNKQVRSTKERVTIGGHYNVLFLARFSLPKKLYHFTLIEFNAWRENFLVVRSYRRRRILISCLEKRQSRVHPGGLSKLTGIPPEHQWPRSERDHMIGQVLINHSASSFETKTLPCILSDFSTLVSYDGCLPWSSSALLSTSGRTWSPTYMVRIILPPSRSIRIIFMEVENVHRNERSNAHYKIAQFTRAKSHKDNIHICDFGCFHLRR